MGCFNSKSTTEKNAGKVSKPSGEQISSRPKRNDAAPKRIPAVAQSNEPTADEGRPAGSSAAQATPEATAEQFLRTVLDGAEHFFSNLPDSLAVKQVVSLTFMNSCVEVIRTKFRLKIDTVTGLVDDLTKKMKLPLLQGSVQNVEERSMDDGFSRILLAWFSKNSTFQKKLSAEAGQAVLDTLYIRYLTSSPVSFEDLLIFQFQWASVNLATLELFSKACEGKDSMTVEQLGKFLRETQRLEITDRQVTEKFKYRFGNGIHRYNFASYSGSVLTNNAIDPARTLDVWQDMTQPFTHYLVSCVRIETKEDLKRAMAESTRALVLNIKKGSDSEPYSGSCSLKDILNEVQTNGFLVNTYPIVLCLSPGTVMPLDLQERVAKMITDTLGSMVAKGLMFEGAAISDPKFSPGAFRKKVLLMSSQGQLKPFIGFMVADMNKDGLGVRVTDVVEDTPAAKGGVLKDDWLTHIKGQAIHNKQHLRECLSQIKVGEEFTLKRENLDELTLVMGGMVDPKDESTATSLSSITFFKYSNTPNYKPWDTQQIDAGSLATSSVTRKDLTDHFAFTSLNPATGKDVIDGEGAASRMGVQFIDISNTDCSLAWSRGRFCDNGRCGYLLKGDLEKLPDFTINIIGGPRVMGCVPLSTAFAVLHGNGTVRQSGSLLTFSGYDDASIAVIKMTFEANGVTNTFAASFGPSLIRTGYCAIPCVPASEERAARKHIHGVYVYSARN